MIGWQKPFRGTQLNRAHPLSRNLIGAWVLNERTGEMIRDSVGGYEGQFVPSAYLRWEPLGVHFWAAQISLGALDLIGGKSEFTIVSRVIKSSDNSFSRIYDHASSSQIGIYVTGKNHLGCTMSTNDGSIDDYSQESSPILSIGEIKTIGVSWSSITGKIQYWGDGQKQGTADRSGAYILASNEIAYIGNRAEGARDFRGDIEYIYFFDRELTEAEMQLIDREPYCMFTRALDIGAMLYTAPVVGGSIINQFQKANLGADLFNGSLI